MGGPENREEHGNGTKDTKMLDHATRMKHESPRRTLGINATRHDMKFIRHAHPSDFEQFSQVMDSLWGSRQAPLPVPMDVFELDSVLNVRAAMPGVTPENLEVTLENGTLTLSGKVEGLAEVNEAKVYQLETATGTFNRTLRLNGRWNVDGIKATLENGIVTVTIPRLESELKRIVKVEVNSAQTAIDTTPGEPPQS